MGNNMYYFFHKHMFRGNLRVPSVDEFLDNNRDYGVQLYVDII